MFFKSQAIVNVTVDIIKSYCFSNRNRNRALSPNTSFASRMKDVLIARQWCSAKFKRVVRTKFATITVVIQSSVKTTIYKYSSSWDHRKPIFLGIPPWGTQCAVRIHKFTHATHTYHANTSCHYLESMMKRISSTLQPIADRVKEFRDYF